MVSDNPSCDPVDPLLMTTHQPREGLPVTGPNLLNKLKICRFLHDLETSRLALDQYLGRGFK